MSDVAIFDPLTIARLLLVGAAAVLLAIGAIIDVRKFIIPNWVNAGLLGLGLVYGVCTSFSSEPFAWVPHIAMLALFFAIGTLIFSFGIMGGGDVKLLAVVAFWSGIEHAPGFLVYTAIAGGLLSVIYLTKAWWRVRREAGSSGGHIKEVAAQAVLAHTGLLTDGKAYVAHVRKSSLMQEPVPYGVAIAAGGVYVFARLTGHLG